MPNPAETKETLARLVANGVMPMQAAEQVGMPPATAKIVMASPMFQALVEKYQGDKVKSIEDRIQGKLDGAILDLIDSVIELGKNARAETTRLRAIELVAKWSDKIKEREAKTEPSLTIIIEGEAALRLHSLDAKLASIASIPTAAMVVKQLAEATEVS